MIPTLFGMSLICLRHHPASARRLPHVAGRRDERQRATIEPGSSSTRCKQRLRPRPADLRAIRQVDLGHPPRAAISAIRSSGTSRSPRLIWDRLGSTLADLVLRAAVRLGRVAVPIGIYSAVRQYSIGDYVFTFLGFLGLAVPNFLLALVADVRRLSLFRAERRRAVLAGVRRRALVVARKFVDLLAHLWIPVIVIGAVRHRGADPHHARQPARRAHKPYVITARAKGLPECQADPEIPGARRAQPVRLDDRLGAAAPRLRRTIIVAIVLNLPTAGPLLLRALMSQDMYLAGSFILLLCALTLVGMLISDILLALARSAHPADLSERAMTVCNLRRRVAVRRDPGRPAIRCAQRRGDRSPSPANGG